MNACEITVTPDSTLMLFQQDGKSERATYSYFRGEKAHLHPIEESYESQQILSEHFTRGLVPPEPFLNRSSCIVAFGSCFAGHISNYLEGIGFNVATKHKSAAYVSTMGDGIVNTYAIRQQFEWAWENHQPAVPLWHGYDAKELGYDEEVRLETKRLFDTADAFIITLGLSEVWYDEPTGEVFWKAVPKRHFDAARHKFRITTQQENLANLSAIHALIRKHRPGASIIFTLSPIPLKATFRPIPCLVADKVSKANLRSALDEFMRSRPDDQNLFYFPSYEIALFGFDHPWMEDRRHMHKHVLDLNMAVFERHFCQTGMCDAELLARFRKAREWDRTVVRDGHWAVPRANLLFHRPPPGAKTWEPSPRPVLEPSPAAPPLPSNKAEQNAARSLKMGIFSFDTNNLGDEMQSFAVLAHLDRADAFLVRDHLADTPGGGETACIFNSWFMMPGDGRKPAPCLQPVWYGFAGWPDSLSPEWISYLRQQAMFNGPIGCRDLYTTRFLQDAGMQAVWTGCLTLFLGTALPFPRAERQGIFFVDVPAEAEAHIPTEVVRRAVRLSTFPPPGAMNHGLERWAMVGRLTRLLAGAELVVTRRLHAALPAAGYGTPVVVVPDARIALARRRFEGYEQFLPLVWLDDAASGLRRIDWKHPTASVIPTPLRIQHEGLCSYLETNGLGGLGRHPSSSPLDSTEGRTQRLVNIAGHTAPGRLRLRLAESLFDLPVLFWCDREVEVALSGFPGLSKLAFNVEACPNGGDQWEPWGPLRDLVRP